MTYKLLTRTAKINDAFRTGPLIRARYDWILSPAVRAHGGAFVASITHAIRDFDGFTNLNDPTGDHDSGVVTIDQITVRWKIEYDRTQPTDISVEREMQKRTMTVTLLSEARG